MMKAVATAVETAERAPGQTPVQPLYLEALTLVERLHRRLLDVIKDEFDRRGRADINSVQALLLYNIGDVGSSRVDLQACKLEYSIVSPK